MPLRSDKPIIPIFDTDIRNMADAMLKQHGRDAEQEAERLARACEARGDQAGCNTWWRVAASIRDAVGISGQPN